MKIKKGFFTRELEITPQEIEDMYSRVHPDTYLWSWFVELLKSFSIK